MKQLGGVKNRMLDSGLRVADFFCGAGGISEGLRQAGHEIVFGLDSNRAATDTFAANHPSAIVICGKIEDVDLEELPHVDMIVGGPPCVEFSRSKQGRGNILSGLALVQSFLRIIYLKKPKYWLMENVPAIIEHLPARIPLDWIGIEEDGFLDVPVRGELHAAGYGVPQNRSRFLMGEFPIPVETHKSPDTPTDLFSSDDDRPAWVTLQEVLESLPSPLSKVTGSTRVKDLNYGYELPVSDLIDHFHEVAMTAEETRRIRKAKEEHPFMGWMPFPDVTDRPARTVVATQLGRETLVISDKSHGDAVYRRASVRECAVIQSYPLTYQFFGGSLNARYRLVGNSVPPLMAYYIGREINHCEGREKSPHPLVATSVSIRPPAIKALTKREHSFPPNRRFCELVPGKEVRGCRAELVNSSTGVADELMSQIQWSARLTVGEGKARMNQAVIRTDKAIAILRPMLLKSSERQNVLRLIDAVDTTLGSKLPNSSELQAKWTGQNVECMGPYEIVDELAEIVDAIYPKAEYSQVFVPPVSDIDFLPKRGIRIRVAAGLLAAAVCAELIHRKESSCISLRRRIDSFVEDDAQQIAAGDV